MYLECSWEEKVMVVVNCFLGLGGSIWDEEGKFIFLVGI